MIAFIAVLSIVTISTEEPVPEPKHVTAITPDGGTVPTVAPGLTRPLAPAFAPELKPQGGVIVTDATLSVYDVNLPIEAALTASSFGLWVFVDYLIKPSLEGDISCRRPVGNGRCNPADLIGFDRYAVGRTSKPWALFSDVALGMAVIAPILYLGLESIALPTREPWGDFGNDLLVVAESMSLSAAFQMVLKFAVRRPRPIRYADLETPVSDFDAELSFPSGHTMMVASATTAFTTTVFLRHPKSPMRWVVLGSGAALTALTAFARVESGNHFPTDVIVASFVGAFAGFAVPYLHRKKLPITPTSSLGPNGLTTFGLAGAW